MSQDLTHLQRLSQRELDTLYRSLPPGSIPQGSSEGRALFFSGTPLSTPASTLAQLIWQGKIFEPAGAGETVLFNRVFGFKAVQAKVFFGPSWLDGKESVIIDYEDTSLLFGSVRDEIRLVEPGLYLGRAYARTWVGRVFVLNFALQFTP